MSTIRFCGHTATRTSEAMSDKHVQTLKTIFKKYAAFGRKDKTKAIKDITSMNYYKMMRECGVLDKKVDNTELDIIFKRYVQVHEFCSK